VSLAASVHLAMHAPNVPFQEVVRAFIASWYKDVATDIPRIEDGYIYPLNKPGLGTKLLPDIAKRPDAIVRRTDLS
jgi:L-alanine-DL-glutamate epimerase-like enolase superfamily enzyme